MNSLFQGNCESNLDPFCPSYACFTLTLQILCSACDGCYQAFWHSFISSPSKITISSVKTNLPALLAHKDSLNNNPCTVLDNKVCKVTCCGETVLSLPLPFLPLCCQWID